MATSFALYGLYVTMGSCNNTTLDNKNLSLKEVPSPGGALPYFGHLFKIPSSLPALKFDEWHRQYGPLIRVKMGVEQWIVIGERRIANDILKAKGAVTSGRPYHLFLSQYHTLQQRGPVFTQPDKRWKKNRTAAQTILGTKGVDQNMYIIESEAARITKMLLEGSANNGNINITKYMQLAPLNVILRTCFGKSVTSIDDPLFLAIVETIDATVKWGAPRQDMGSFLPAFSKIFELFMGTEEHMQHYTYEVRNPLFRRLIQEAVKNDTPCFAKVMHRLKEEDEFEEDDIIVFMSDMVNAGTDPTAVTLMWAFVILSHYPNVQKKICDEVDEFITMHNRLPHYSERENFPYLISVQKECMRYRSAKHLAIPQKATQDFEYQGYIISEGAVILPNTYTLCGSTEFYDSPEEFIPERYINDLSSFSESVNASIDVRDQYTFGWGRRMCPGVHLVDVEFFNIWVHIFAASIIEPKLDKDGKFKYVDLNRCNDLGILVAPENPYLRFVKRPDCLI
ncbi:cytochrome P450 [Phascolomyces articulosus]|uniref:Cytochrome P450 n=1 Tax=Phascolomyces articulosus TaxID=60185 RepID=A0AAD5JXE4_9FUNG|nr:cytochrome P450 [Phascolomyces articulosus]